MGSFTAEYIRNPAGVGNMTNSRNVALKRATGDIIAFLDDDAYPEPGYIAALCNAYSDPTVALGCSRTLNGQPGESTEGVDQIGRFSEEDGYLTGHFAADSGAMIDIDHGIGATMSFRRSTLADLGGFREDYRGISGVREDADAFLRARRLGYRAVFIPDAVALHVAAPQAKGRRFDLRYQRAVSRNHAILLANNFGLHPRLLGRYVAKVVHSILASPSRSWLRRLTRLGVALAGTVEGLAKSAGRHGPKARDPRRQDAEAQSLRMWLSHSAH
jgi:GT2 family glycosyltransferase